MGSQYLKEGTVLAEQYRIDGVLGQGGFGITYSGSNIRIDMRVAIKELYWRGHCDRDADRTSNVCLTNGTDRETFEKQKKALLKEARTLRDFSGNEGVVRVLDYLEANDTAYIVMEYVDGITMGEYLRANGPMPAEEALSRLLPLIDSMEQVHRSGVIHRDISPDNIMIRPDGSLKLIDFGAARSYNGTSGEFTAITKLNYTPVEQYNRHGVQGPWTDVYALCATAYTMVTGREPDCSVQRALLDELKTPSELGTDIAPKYEAVIMHGMKILTAERYQSMGELGEAIRAALPHETPKANRKAVIVLSAVMVCLLCLLCLAGFLLYRSPRTDDRFKGIVTETFLLRGSESMSLADFNAAETELRSCLDSIAGESNYEVTREGMCYKVVLPLDCFEGAPIESVLCEKFADLVANGEKFKVSWQDVVNWEDPETASVKGKNQIPASEFTENTIVYEYTLPDSKTLSAGEMLDLYTSIKERLDALGTPYAFGIPYGSQDEAFEVRLLPEYASSFLEKTLAGDTLYITEITNSEYLWTSIGMSCEFIENDKGGMELRCQMNDNNMEKLEEITGAILENGHSELYLSDSFYGQNRNTVAVCTVSEPITDGLVVFSDFLFEGTEEAVQGTVQYLGTMVTGIEPPAGCQLHACGVLDADGNTLFDEDAKSLYGVSTTKSKEAKDANGYAKTLLTRIAETEGVHVNEGSNYYVITMNLSRYTNWPIEFLEKTVDLFTRYDLSTILRNGSFMYIMPFAEEDNEYVRLIGSCDLENGAKLSVAFSVEPWSVYFNDFADAWNAVDWEVLGLQRVELEHYEEDGTSTVWESPY